MKLLKTLEEKYSLEFLEVMTFPKKYESLAYFVSEYLEDTLKSKWNNFNYKVDESKYDKIILGEKTGKDYVPSNNKPKNTKQFLT